ncbi:hypothetical protein EJ05DRAFT_505227 [Pseudovirgaria hyperparasitica]|uniref:Uncharacterized protein n=1 Tax=Pseudovirgaria hyperparasitica TaxID=470096 RepID=A0A6A6VRB4_9PEZI|nr:uncharacterized protein EJ05DRAFT_505227 [Pseudovirgaria hyperparasitica]KAF2753218.1 hypothetical protein EJ05DRAFT_505227 [Pseudovirgaria hyperparasitica]
MSLLPDLRIYDTDPTLYLVTSLTAGNSHIVSATSRMETILRANKIPFTGVDTATDERMRSLWSRRARGKRFPGLVREGFLVGDLEQIEEWNEFGELLENLAPLGGAASVPASAPAPAAKAALAEAPVSIPTNARQKTENESPKVASGPPQTMAMRQMVQEAAAKGRELKGGDKGAGLKDVRLSGGIDRSRPKVPPADVREARIAARDAGGVVEGGKGDKDEDDGEEEDDDEDGEEDENDEESGDEEKETTVIRKDQKVLAEEKSTPVSEEKKPATTTKNEDEKDDEDDDEEDEDDDDDDDEEEESENDDDTANPSNSTPTEPPATTHAATTTSSKPAASPSAAGETVGD